MLKIMKWIFINALFLAILIYAIYWQSEWAYNLILFWIWTVGVISLAFFSKTVIEEYRKKNPKPTVPIWVDRIYDLTIVSILAANGWVWSAIIWFIQIIAISGIYREEDKK